MPYNGIKKKKQKTKQKNTLCRAWRPTSFPTTSRRESKSLRRQRASPVPPARAIGRGTDAGDLPQALHRAPLAVVPQRLDVLARGSLLRTRCVSSVAPELYAAGRCARVPNRHRARGLTSTTASGSTHLDGPMAAVRESGAYLVSRTTYTPPVLESRIRSPGRTAIRSSRGARWPLRTRASFARTRLSPPS